MQFLKTVAGKTNIFFINILVYQENSRRARQRKFLAWQVCSIGSYYDKEFILFNESSVFLIGIFHSVFSNAI